MLPQLLWIVNQARNLLRPIPLGCIVQRLIVNPLVRSCRIQQVVPNGIRIFRCIFSGCVGRLKKHLDLITVSGINIKYQTTPNVWITWFCSPHRVNVMEHSDKTFTYPQYLVVFEIQNHLSRRSGIADKHYIDSDSVDNDLALLLNPIRRIKSTRPARYPDCKTGCHTPRRTGLSRSELKHLLAHIYNIGICGLLYHCRSLMPRSIDRNILITDQPPQSTTCISVQIRYARSDNNGRNMTDYFLPQRLLCETESCT